MAAGSTLFVDAGAATVWRGSPVGLRTVEDLRLNGISNNANCGTALAAGDFDDDGRDELVVSVPGAIWDGVDHSGEVRVWTKPSNTWISIRPGTRATIFRATTAVRPDRSVARGGRLRQRRLRRSRDRRAGGERHAAGRLGGPRRGVDRRALRRPRRALQESGVQLLHEGARGCPGAQANARFGFSSPPATSTAISTTTWSSAFRSATRPARSDSGEIVVLFGSATGLVTAGHQRFDDSDFAGGAVAAGDQFGYALAAGRFARPAPARSWSATTRSRRDPWRAGSAAPSRPAGSSRPTARRADSRRPARSSGARAASARR